MDKNLMDALYVEHDGKKSDKTQRDEHFGELQASFELR